jgi:uncharacterized protein
MSHASADPTISCAIAVMATPGKAKTRLMPLVGAEGAAELNTAFLRDITANLHAARDQAHIDAWMAFAPAGAEPFFRALFPSGVGLLETVAPDLGACLLKAVTTLLERGYDSACLLNSDSPTLPPAYLVAAATALAADGNGIVIGPAVDGGYYLIGMKRPHARLFADIEWSTERVFDQTMARARELGLPVTVLPSWYDVDDQETLATLAGELFDGRPFRAGSARAPASMHTRAAMRRVLDNPVFAKALQNPNAKPDNA